MQREWVFVSFSRPTHKSVTYYMFKKKKLLQFEKQCSKTASVFTELESKRSNSSPAHRDEYFDKECVHKYMCTTRAHACTHTLLYNICPSYISSNVWGGAMTSLQLHNGWRRWSGKFWNPLTEYHRFIKKLMIHPLCHKTVFQNIFRSFYYYRRGYRL